MCVLAKLTRLQLDLNASARLLRGTREQKHAQIWAALHWLPVQITTDFKWLFFVVGILRISSDTGNIILITKHDRESPTNS